VDGGLNLLHLTSHGRLGRKDLLSSADRDYLSYLFSFVEVQIRIQVKELAISLFDVSMSMMLFTSLYQCFQDFVWVDMLRVLLPMLNGDEVEYIHQAV